MSEHGIIGEKEVEHIAHLARIEISEEEKIKLSHELQDILAYVDMLQEIDTDQIEATFFVVPQVNALREDETAPSLPLSLVLSNAPLAEGNMFRMPKILAEE